MPFEAYHSVNLVILAVAIIWTGIRIARLRKTSATYNARLLRFAYFSLASWIIWTLQYLTLLTAPPTSGPRSFFLNAGLALGVIHNAVWAGAVFSLISKQSSRHCLTLSALITLSNVIAFLALETSILTSGLFTQIDAVLAGTVFAAFAILSVNEWHLSKIVAAIFVIHGFSQGIWRALWFTPLANTHPAILFGFPVSRLALVFAWTKLISAILERAQPSHQRVVRDIERLKLPDPMATRLVMISSTIDDLGQEREAADRAIAGLGLTRFRAETFGSLPHTPRQVCAWMADRCDLFILITGERYGSIEEGISVVQFEYEIARAQNSKKILVYVKDRVNRETRLTEFLNHVQDFDEGYFRSLFTTPEQLFEQIQRDIGRWLGSQVN
jgi:Domain of unknown function (DUF4062)